MASDPSELPEKDFIQEEPPSRRPLWLFLFLLLIIFGLLWGIGVWQQEVLSTLRKESPFLQVTNRDFSLFLWQNPEFMRANVSNKFGYLPHFSSDDDIRVIPELAEEYVSAPPEVIFRYHVWNRLLGDTLAPRPILADQFVEFLHANREWQPQNWVGAPAEYAALVKRLSEMGREDVRTLLPFKPSLAFQGWKNYFMEWEKISSVHPTIEQMQMFLKEHPTYNRSYWRNILSEKTPDYLKSFMWSPRESSVAEGEVPQEELSCFLRVGYFNYSTMTKPSS